MTSSHNLLDLYHFAKEEFEKAPEEVYRPTPLLTGRDLIDAGLIPGPRFKQLLQDLEDAQLENRLREHGRERYMSEHRGEAHDVNELGRAQAALRDAEKKVADARKRPVGVMPGIGRHIPIIREDRTGFTHAG